MQLWVLVLLLHLVGDSSGACDLQKLPVNCNTDLLTGDAQGLQEEARRAAQCLLNDNHQHGESVTNVFKCLIDHVDHLLPPQEHRFQESPEHRCVLCQVVQLYNCERTLAHAQCRERFIVQINNIHKKMKYLGITQQAVNPWIRRFLDVSNWNFYRFRTSQTRNESINPLRPAYVYVRKEAHYMDRVKDRLSSFLVRVGGIPGLITIKFLYFVCLMMNFLLFKIFVCQREMRAHTVLLNLVIGNVLNLLFDNFVAVFFLTHWYPSQLTVSTLVYFNYAIVALQIYTVILYSMQRKFSAPRPSFLRRHASLLVSVLLWMIAAIVPAPICLFTMSAKNGILYSFTIYVLIPVVSILICSKEKHFENNENICNCQGCSEISSTEKMCQNFVDRTLQTERWLESNPAETSFDSEINSGETAFCSENERHDSLEESALHLQRSSQQCSVQLTSRSQGARFQRALATVYVVTYLPAICLYLALYFAIRREEFISYRRLCVYIYSFLNPLALYIVDKALRRSFKNAVCCCCARFKKRPDKFSLGY